MAGTHGTSGKDVGQRHLGNFETELEAAEAVFFWIIGITPNPPTPHRVKPDRAKRGEAEMQPKKKRSKPDQGARTKIPSAASHNISQLTPPASQVARTCARASHSPPRLPRLAGGRCSRPASRLARPQPPALSAISCGLLWRTSRRSGSSRASREGADGRRDAGSWCRIISEK